MYYINGNFKGKINTIVGYNKNRIRLKSAAQYGLRMFWKDVNISKSEEDTK